MVWWGCGAFIEAWVFFGVVVGAVVVVAVLVVWGSVWGAFLGFFWAADVGADRCVQWVHGMLCCVVYCRVACMCSLGYSEIGKDGAVAIAGALAHVPQLTMLEYVPSRGLVCGCVCMGGGDVAPLWRRGIFE